jgi:hypothetical protein
MFGRANSDSVGDEASQNLAPTVEAVPEVHSSALFVTGIPLFIFSIKELPLQ